MQSILTDSNSSTNSRQSQIPSTHQSPDFESNLSERFLMSFKETQHSASAPLHGMWNRYEVECVLQKAIFGEVLLVKSLWTEQPKQWVLKVAQKALLKRGVAADGCQVFEDYEQEISILSASREDPHPNLLAAAPAGNQVPDDLSTCYTCLPYLKGGELFALIERDGALGDNLEAKQMSRGIAEGIQHLHRELGFSHNDISLENVLLTSVGRPVVCDFGLALPLGEAWDPMRRFSGKLQYQAPEVFLGTVRHASAAADIFSLGVTIFVLITGIPPFEAPDAASDLRFSYIQNCRMRELLDLWQQEVSAEAVEMLTGMLVADPRKRMTMEEVLAHPWMRGGLPLPTPQETQNIDICAGETIRRKIPSSQCTREDGMGDTNASDCLSPSSVFSFETAFRRHRATAVPATQATASTLEFRI